MLLHPYLLIFHKVASIIEQHHDENGIVWPLAVAPYHVSVIPVNVKDENQLEAANQLYEKLIGMGVEALIDDRNERAGVKFKDSELIGVPIRVTVGKKIGEGIVEFKLRDGEMREVQLEDVYDIIKDEFDKNNIRYFIQCKSIRYCPKLMLKIFNVLR